MKKIVLVLAVLLVSVMSCENPFLKKMLVEEEKGKTVPQVPKHTINFGVGSGLGTLKAQVDGKEINSGDSVEQGKSVVFTAEPSEVTALTLMSSLFGLKMSEAPPSTKSD